MRKIATNLTYVGSAACLTLATVKVVFICEDAPHHVVAAAIAQAEGQADILVTVPSPVGAGGPHIVSRQFGLELKPRYHFCSAGAFKRHEPFRPGEVKHGTYVVELGTVGGGGQWVYGVDMTPLENMSHKNMIATVPEDGGESLYDQNRKRAMREIDEAVEEGQRVLAERETCWFCPGSMGLMHLVVLRAKHVYVAVAKGGLNASHLMIVPTAHVGGATSNELEEEAIQEMKDVMLVVKRVFSRMMDGASVYFFERCGEVDAGRVRHMHVQAVAVRPEAIRRIGQVCEEIGMQLGVSVRVQGEVGQKEGNEWRWKETEESMPGLCMDEVRRRKLKEYFWGEFGNGVRVVVPFTRVKEGDKVLPVHFGRTVMAKALGQMERIDWRSCEVSEKDERELAELLKKQVEETAEKDKDVKRVVRKLMGIGT